MTLHRLIEGLLLAGVHLQAPPAPIQAEPPARLRPLVEALRPEHEAFDRIAIEFGHRYRSGFWAIYLLSAVAVACAVLPLALGWDSPSHALHPLAGLWALAEVLVICAVVAIYRHGHRSDWQGRWLRARAQAELAKYLPLVAPLLDGPAADAAADWYRRAFGRDAAPGTPLQIPELCVRHEDLASRCLQGVWSDPSFAPGYATWAISVLDSQRHYHEAVACKQHALVARVHRITTALFGLTALGASLHLFLHSYWLSLVTTFFPALGASLHGALAQSESHRLAAHAEGLVRDLSAAIDGIRPYGGAPGVQPGAQQQQLRTRVRDAIALILEEHRDWHALVHPHRLLLP